MDSRAARAYGGFVPGEPAVQSQVESGIDRDPSNLIPVIRAEGGRALDRHRTACTPFPSVRKEGERAMPDAAIPAAPYAAHAPAWSALILGLFLLAAAIDVLRRPGQWHRMIEEIEGSPALQMLTGLFEIIFGTLLYLANRGPDGWPAGDPLALVLTILGGLAVIEALAVTAFADLYVRFWMRKLGTRTRPLAVLALLLGLGFTAAGLLRLV